MGYDTTNFVLIGAPFLLLAFLLILLAIITLSMRLFETDNKGFTTVYATLAFIMFYNAFLRLALEAFLDIFMASVQCQMAMNYEGSAEVFSTTLAIFIGITYFALPVGMVILLQNYKERLSLDEYRSTFGAVYEYLSYEKKCSRFFNLIFLFRRSCLIGAFLFLGSLPGAQVQLFIMTSLLCLTYIILIKPFSQMQHNKVEAFNEACVLLVGLAFIGFTEEYDFYFLRESLGEIVMGIVCLNFVANVCFSIFHVAAFVIAKIKMRRALEPHIVRIEQ